MFSVAQKRHISEQVQQILRATNHPELPEGEITFVLRVCGAEDWSWATIQNNSAVPNPDINPHNERQDPATRPVVVDPTKYVTTPEMGEISGFGGGYEDCCRRMLQAGCHWLEAHPNANPQFKGSKGVFGLILEDNPEAAALTEAVIDGSYDPETKQKESTGAMHHAVILRLLHIKKVGWAKYVEECVAFEKENPTEKMS